MKICLLTEDVSIELKGTYSMKMCLLTEKCAY